MAFNFDFGSGGMEQRIDPNAIAAAFGIGSSEMQKVAEPAPVAPPVGMTYGTPDQKMGNPIHNFMRSINSYTSNMDNLKAASLAAKLIGALGQGTTPGARATNFGNVVSNALSSNVLAQGHPIVQPKKALTLQVNPNAPIQATRVADTGTGTGIGAANPTLQTMPNSSEILTQDSGSVPQGVVSGFRAGLTPSDAMTIGALTYDPATGKGGFNTVLETLKERAAADTASRLAGAHETSAQASMLKEILAGRLQPYTIDKMVSEIAENKAKTTDLTLKNTGQGTYSPEYLGRVEGAKKTAELDAITKNREDLAKSPIGQLQISPELKRLDPAIAGFSTFGQLAMAGMDIHHLSTNITSRLNAQNAAGGEITKAQISAVAQIRGVLSEQMSAAAKGVMFYDGILQNAGINSLPQDKKDEALANKKFFSNLLTTTKTEMDKLSQAMGAVAKVPSTTPEQNVAQQKMGMAKMLEAVKKTIPGATELRIGANGGYEVKTNEGWFTLKQGGK